MVHLRWKRRGGGKRRLMGMEDVDEEALASNSTAAFCQIGRENHRGEREGAEEEPLSYRPAADNTKSQNKSHV